MVFRVRYSLEITAHFGHIASAYCLERIFQEKSDPFSDVHADLFLTRIIIISHEKFLNKLVVVRFIFCSKCSPYHVVLFWVVRLGRAAEEKYQSVGDKHNNHSTATSILELKAGTAATSTLTSPGGQ